MALFKNPRISGNQDKWKYIVKAVWTTAWRHRNTLVRNEYSTNIMYKFTYPNHYIINSFKRPTHEILPWNYTHKKAKVYIIYLFDGSYLYMEISVDLFFPIWSHFFTWTTKIPYKTSNFYIPSYWDIQKCVSLYNPKSILSDIENSSVYLYSFTHIYIVHCAVKWFKAFFLKPQNNQIHFTFHCINVDSKFLFQGLRTGPTVQDKQWTSKNQQYCTSPSLLPSKVVSEEVEKS